MTPYFIETTLKQYKSTSNFSLVGITFAKCFFKSNIILPPTD